MTPIDPAEIEWTAIRAQGAGGQNVNKVASAVHLRFDIRASSLPEPVKTRLCAHRDQRITADGVIVIKAQQYRSQDRNREDALARLQELVDSATAVPCGNTSMALPFTVPLPNRGKPASAAWAKARNPTCIHA